MTAKVIESEIDHIMRIHSELGVSLQPTRLTATLVHGNGQYYHGVYGDWNVSEGTILGAPVRSFGETIDLMLPLAPDRFIDAHYTFQKTADKTRRECGIPIRELRYQLV